MTDSLASETVVPLLRGRFGKPYTYMAAGEQADKLTTQFGEQYEFKVMHESLIRKSA